MNFEQRYPLYLCFVDLNDGNTYQSMSEYDDKLVQRGWVSNFVELREKQNRVYAESLVSPEHAIKMVKEKCLELRDKLDNCLKKLGE